MTYLSRSPLLLRLLEQQAVPTDPRVRRAAQTSIGYPPPGMIRKRRTYPAGESGFDDEWPDTPEGRRLGGAEASLFLKRIKIGNRVIKH